MTFSFNQVLWLTKQPPVATGRVESRWKELAVVSNKLLPLLSMSQAVHIEFSNHFSLPSRSKLPQTQSPSLAASSSPPRAGKQSLVTNPQHPQPFLLPHRGFHVNNALRLHWSPQPWSRANQPRLCSLSWLQIKGISKSQALRFYQLQATSHKSNFQLRVTAQSMWWTGICPQPTQISSWEHRRRSLYLGPSPSTRSPYPPWQTMGQGGKATGILQVLKLKGIQDHPKQKAWARS